jgi:hypothetical protein
MASGFVDDRTSGTISVLAENIGAATVARGFVSLPAGVFIPLSVDSPEGDAAAGLATEPVSLSGRVILVNRVTEV